MTLERQKMRKEKNDLKIILLNNILKKHLEIKNLWYLL